MPANFKLIGFFAMKKKEEIYSKKKKKNNMKNLLLIDIHNTYIYLNSKDYNQN